MTQTAPQESLLLAFELGKKKWKLTFGCGGTKRSLVEIPARDLRALLGQIRNAKRKLRLPAAAPVVSCYEAGRDGFWLQRYLAAQGIRNVVVDPASIEVPRRKRRAKSDRLDGAALLRMLARYEGGDREVWHVVRVPDEAAEDERRLHRELGRLTKEEGGHESRIESLLALEGVWLGTGRKFLEQLEQQRRWNGTALGLDLVAELKREYRRLVLVREQIRELKAEQDARLREVRAGRPASAGLQKTVALQRLRGVDRGAWVLGMEFFGWRNFRNRREVGALAGLTGTPYQSGESNREQGISKAGNRRVCALMVELAWCWLRYQPQSKLSRWYAERYAKGGKRTRRVGSVAVARRLLVDLWKYLESGEVPEGAALKAA